MNTFIRASMLIAMGLSAGTQAAAAAEPVKVLAAGSLTGAMGAVIKLYQEKTGERVEADFGPAGLLRERIEGGEAADIFASANMAHPRTLAAAGKATPPVVMARNKICARALPSFGLNSRNVLELMLDPKTMGIGTSTPKADPGGDYAYAVFDRAEKVRPGAKAILEGKAQQLVGGKDNPPVPAGRNAMEYFMEQQRIQISLGYCSSRETKPDTKLTTVVLPANIAVTADYGLSVLSTGKAPREATMKFALFVMTPEAQAVIAKYGFTPVGNSVSRTGF